jgi:microcystin degradation protein MlrC
MRIGVALIQQETNTFALQRCEWNDFTVLTGTAAAGYTSGANSEMGGATSTIEANGHEAVPLAYAWTLPSGVVTGEAFDRLRSLLVDSVSAAGGLDGLVLSLHGSMVADEHQDADATLIETARTAAEAIPIGVSLDLHANVTRRMVAGADAMVGYHTDPHVDLALTGRRIATQVIGILEGALTPTFALAKRPMIVPAESMNTTSGPLGAIRRDADAVADALDISLFPVQPWLDVPELGLGVLATTDDNLPRAVALAEEFAERIWQGRGGFAIPRFLPPDAAIAAAASSSVRPFVIAESADAPTAGASGDSPAMVAALLERRTGLAAVVPIVDGPAVDVCHNAGVAAEVAVPVGASIDNRWSKPVPIRGTVVRLGGGSYLLEGAGYTGIRVSMGRWAVVESGETSLLISERPAWTADQATFRFAGIDLARTDLLVVRSCSDFRPNFPEAAESAVTLDVPGAATPRLTNLEFTEADRPLWPLDRFPDDQ